MTELSAVVVQARVGTMRVVEEEKGVLKTLIDLEVLASFKGKAEVGSVITLLQMGGQKCDFINARSILGKLVRFSDNSVDFMITRSILYDSSFGFI